MKTSHLMGKIQLPYRAHIVHAPSGEQVWHEDTPVLGTLLIKPFREHHRDPQGICRHGFVEVNANNCLGVILTFLIELWVKPDAAGYPSLIVRGSLFALALAMLGTNQFHKWAHAKSVPRIVIWVQQKNLILKPAHHQMHHSGRYDDRYCITTGWLNLLLDPIRFFRSAEWCVNLLLLPFRSKSRRA